MILTDREIQIAIKCGQIGIDPLPDPTAYSSTSLDLTLASHGWIWRAHAGQPIRPGARGYKYTDTRHRQERVSVDGYTLEPKGFLLAYTKEKVNLPITSRVAARVEGKSSISRLGVGIHITAPTIHAGFNAPLQLEMFNFGPHEMILDEGMKICQLIFEQTTGTPEQGYQGMFADQRAA
jgi:dCTP deaminase